MAHQPKHEPSLFLVLCWTWLSLCVPVLSARAQGGGAAEQAAKAQAEHGVRAFAEGDYHAAIAAFVRADQLRPNPAFVYDIGRAHEELHATDRALFFYREYLRRAPGAADRREVLARIDALSQHRPEPRSHTLRVRTQPAGASVWIDSEPVGKSPLELELPGGAHHATFRMPGRRPQSVRIELSRDQGPTEVEARLAPEGASASATRQPAPAASTQATKPTNPRPDQRQHVLRSVGFGAMLASVGALGGAVAFEVMRADSERSAAQARETLRPTQAADRAQTQKTLSRVFAGAGGGLAAIGITLLVLSREPSEERRPTSRVALHCAFTKCRAELSGVF
jgi:hypothetical protein